MSLDELDALHAAATAGPWEVLVTPESQFCEWRVVGPHYDDAFSDAGQSPCDDDTRDAIVALHNAWPTFSARLRAAEAEVERMRAALFPIATGRFASVSEACDIAEAALGAEAVAVWNAAENARAALGEP